MKPIALSGHTRSLTHIKFNTEGDLLFSASKDSTPSVWWSHNGERLGSYDGHKGTVWCLDPTYDSKLLVTGSADFSCKIWDVQYGKNLATFDTKSAVRACAFSYSSNEFFYTTDATMGQTSELRMFKVADVKTAGAAAEPYLVIPAGKKDQAITSAKWGPCDDTIITGHKGGDIAVWDATTGEELQRDTTSHSLDINDIQYNEDMTLMITASKDTKARLWDVMNLEPVKLYQTERPVNSASISPLKDQVLLGGGQDAMSVTTTSSRVGKFEATFWHSIYEVEIGRVKGHFGPINTLAFRPNGRGYASGGEDGFIRLHDFDDTYFTFDFK